MGVDVWFPKGIADVIKAGACLALDGAKRQGGDLLFLAGVLAMAKHNAQSVGINWPALIHEIESASTEEEQRLLNRALALGPGARIGPGA